MYYYPFKYDQIKRRWLCIRSAMRINVETCERALSKASGRKRDYIVRAYNNANDKIDGCIDGFIDFFFRYVQPDFWKGEPWEENIKNFYSIYAGIDEDDPELF